MYHKKRKNKKWISFLGIVVFIFLFIGIDHILDGNLLKPVKIILKDTSLGIARVSEFPFLKKQDSNQIQEMNPYLAELEEYKKVTDELKKILDLHTTLQEYHPISAVTVNRNMGYWYHSLTINKGSNSGIAVGMPVVVDKGLIGKISDVTLYHSTVELLTSDEISKISVKIKVGEEYLYGLLTGFDSETNCFQVEGISDNKEIPEGSIVTTTGMGEFFPSGLYIGTVLETHKDHFDLARILEVKSEVNFDDLGIVTVIERKDHS